MAMQTLAYSRSLFPVSPRLSPAPVSGGGRSSSSMRGVCTFKCLSLSSPSSADDAVKFKEASKDGNLIPLQRRIFSDQLTPVIAYRCLVKEDDREAPSFLYESVEPGFQTSTSGRYSVVGAQPALEIVAKEYEVTIVDHEKGHLTEESVDDPMTILRRISKTWKPQLIDDLPHAFCGGWVGYFSYDTVRYKEKKKLAFSSAPQDDRNLADIHLGLYDDVLVFDHVEEKTYAIHWVRLDQYPSVEDAYSDGMKRLDLLVSRVQDIDLLPPGSVDLNTYHFSPALSKSNMTSEEYKKAVLQATEHILGGEIFQIVLSQRFECRTFADPFEVYRALRHVNPSPYMTYLQAKGCILVASSPEILTRVRQGTGELDDQLTCWDALQSALPAGTVSGAPKLKAMELIDQLEVTRRGPYSGGFGGISYLGDMDIALALRTIIFPTGMHKDANKQREWIAYLQAGAGIVADSNPDDKHQECQNKAAGLARAIDLAESAFVNKCT